MNAGWSHFPQIKHPGRTLQSHLQNHTCMSGIFLQDTLGVKQQFYINTTLFKSYAATYL